MLSTLESLVYTSEYPPVAPTHLHKGLKYKINNIFTNVRPQSTVLLSAIQIAWVRAYTR